MRTRARRRCFARLRENSGRRLTGAEFVLWRPRPNEGPLAQASGLVPFAPPFEARSTRAGRSIAAARRLRSFMVRRTIGRTGAFQSRARLKARMKEQTFSEACLRYLNANPQLFDVLVDVSGYAYGDAGGCLVTRPCPLYPSIVARQRSRSSSCRKPGVHSTLRRTSLQSGTCSERDNVHFYSRDAESSRFLGIVLGQENQAAEPLPDIAFLFDGGSPDQGRDPTEKDGMHVGEADSGNCAEHARLRARRGCRSRERIRSSARHLGATVHGTVGCRRRTPIQRDVLVRKN